MKRQYVKKVVTVKTDQDSQSCSRSTNSCNEQDSQRNKDSGSPKHLQCDCNKKGYKCTHESNDDKKSNDILCVCSKISKPHYLKDHKFNKYDRDDLICVCSKIPKPHYIRDHNDNKNRKHHKNNICLCTKIQKPHTIEDHDRKLKNELKHEHKSHHDDYDVVINKLNNINKNIGSLDDNMEKFAYKTTMDLDCIDHNVNSANQKIDSLTHTCNGIYTLVNNNSGGGGGGGGGGGQDALIIQKIDALTDSFNSFVATYTSDYSNLLDTQASQDATLASILAAVSPAGIAANTKHTNPFQQQSNNVRSVFYENQSVPYVYGNLQSQTQSNNNDLVLNDISKKINDLTDQMRNIHHRPSRR